MHINLNWVDQCGAGVQKLQEATTTDWKPYRHISLREWHLVLACGLKQRRSSNSNWQQELAWTNFFQICRTCGKHLSILIVTLSIPIKLLVCVMQWCNDTCERLLNLTHRNDLHHFQSRRTNGQHFDGHVPVPPWRQCFWSQRVARASFVDRPGGVCSIASSGSGPVIRKRIKMAPGFPSLQRNM